MRIAEFRITRFQFARDRIVGDSQVRIDTANIEPRPYRRLRPPRVPVPQVIKKGGKVRTVGSEKVVIVHICRFLHRRTAACVVNMI